MDGGVGRPESAVEMALARVLDRALRRRVPGSGLGVRSVDVAGPPRLGGFRAFLSGPVPATRAEGNALGRALLADDDVEQAAWVHDRLCWGPSYAALAGALREHGGVARDVDRDVPGVVVVFCSPNTNKPLHLGHLRACFLGMALSRIVEHAALLPVARSQMLSNVGVHVCQALAAEERRDPDARAVTAKGDVHVGALYREYHEAVADVGCDDDRHSDADEPTECLRCRPQQLLRQMVEGDEVLRAASTRLTETAIDGISATQRRVGAVYDAELRESLSLPTAYAAIERALAEGSLRRREDGSVCLDIEHAGDAELTLLRRDGTALVFAMLLGIYHDRDARYPGWRTVELTGEHWRAGRLAMYEVLRRTGRGDISDRTEGAFFGMVKRSGSVMSSRAGSVVLADELLDEFAVRAAAWEPGLDAERLGVSLLGYAILSVPRLAPIDFDLDVLWDAATTGYGRVLRAVALAEEPAVAGRAAPERAARALAMALAKEQATAWRAWQERDPSVLVRYVDALCEQALPVLSCGDAEPLRAAFARVVRRALGTLGLPLPEPAREPATLAGAG